MHIESLHVERFRGIRDLSLTFESGLTVLVGENNTGKSSIGLALSRVLAAGEANNNSFPETDRHYGTAEPFTIDVGIRLSDQEFTKLIRDPIIPDGFPQERLTALTQWLPEQHEIVHMVFRPHGVDLECGSLKTYQSLIGVRPNQDHGRWEDFIQNGSPRDWASRDSLDQALSARSYHLQVAVAQDVSRQLNDRFKLVPEFRSPVALARTGALESMAGPETAGVLFNLKNSTAVSDRQRFQKIVLTFCQFFPRFHVEVVSSSPGDSNPDIQFIEEGRDNPLSLSQVSAGVHEMLTFITNLVDKEGLIWFIEHPESHLHPHAMRSLNSLLAYASERNQIIIVTHDPHFIDPGAPHSLRRFWWTPELGTSTYRLNPDVPEIVVGQIATALRNLGHREVLFARGVILVEDESQELFLRMVAPTLGYDLDAGSISVIPVGGDGGFRPYVSLLESLGIPHVLLRDKTWGHNPGYPVERYFALGAELEQYLDDLGHRARRKRIKSEIGTGKPRVAAQLGSELSYEMVPAIFSDLLEAAVKLADGRPMPVAVNASNEESTDLT